MDLLDSAADRPGRTRRPASAVELAARGWTRRFVGMPPRLREVADLYRTLGHEVRLEPLGPEDLSDGCEGCVAATALFRTVYTRRPE